MRSDCLRVMVFGTFDVFHEGHRFFIAEAMKKGKVQNPKSKAHSHFTIEDSTVEVIVVIARDVTVRRIKPLLRNTEQTRRRKVQEAFPEATVVLGDEKDPMKVVREYQPDMVCLGYDQVGFSEQLTQEFPDIPVERIGAYFPEKYKSSLVGSDE